MDANTRLMVMMKHLMILMLPEVSSLCSSREKRLREKPYIEIISFI